MFIHERHILKGIIPSNIHKSYINLTDYAYTIQSEFTQHNLYHFPSTMTEQLIYSMTDIEKDENLFVVNREKENAPDAACFPENKLWIPEFGDTLIVIARHPEQIPYSNGINDTAGQEFDTDLSEEGVKQAEDKARELFREIGYTPIPRKYSWHYTNRKRTQQASTIKYQKFLLDDPSPFHVVERGIDIRMNTADQLSPLVKMYPNQAEKIIPTYLSTPDTELEKIGSEPKDLTFRKIIDYIREKNERSLAEDDDVNLHTYFVDSHETTLALLLNKFFPDEDPQANHAEMMAITTGNPDNLMSIVWRDLPPRQVSLDDI